MATNHQYAGDARVPFSHGGSGFGRVTVKVPVTAIEAETDNTQWLLYKAAKPCSVSNFAIGATDLDTDATPTLVLDVGIDGVSSADTDEFIDGSTVGQAGTEGVTGIIDLGSSGFPLVAGDYITLNVEVPADADKGAAGYVVVSFDVSSTPEA